MKLKNRVKELYASPIKKRVDARLKQLSKNKNYFSELCFCLLTANSTAQKGIEIQDSVGKGFENFSQKKLVEFLKKKGYRFYNRRAEFICEARENKDNLCFSDEYSARDWLVENIKGIGMKEASHFLRNIGFLDVAILDRHILRLMKEEGLIKEIPKTMTKNKYLEIEKVLRGFSKKLGLSLAELDFYLWFLATGKILK